jgi:CO/xanthine dehydrogenase FAD-binding subunit
LKSPIREYSMVTFYRRLPRVDYIRPKSIDDLLELLSDNHDERYRVYAGGTDLIPKLKARAISPPEAIVDLKGLPGMDYIDYDKNHGLRIGALTTIRSIETSPVVREKYPFLSQASASIASIQVRNRGTMAGNICNAVPSADSAPPLLSLEARLFCVSKKRERILNIDEFFTGPNRCALEPDEILREIQIPAMPEKGRGVFIKLSPRSRMDLAVVNVTVLFVKEKGQFKDVRISLGAVAPTPMRARKAERSLEGVKADDKAILNAAKIASAESKPIDDHRASAEYRRMMVEVLVRRAIRQVIST